MSGKLINPESFPAPQGYNNGILMPPGSTLFIAGQIGWNRECHLVSDSFPEQFDQALANVIAVVRTAGGLPENIGHLRIFVIDKDEYLSHRAEIGQMYRKRMGRHFPAMSLVEVKALLEPGAQVEIEGVAVI